MMISWISTPDACQKLRYNHVCLYVALHSVIACVTDRQMAFSLPKLHSAYTVDQVLPARVFSTLPFWSFCCANIHPLVDVP